MENGNKADNTGRGDPPGPLDVSSITSITLYPIFSNR